MDVSIVEPWRKRYSKEIVLVTGGAGAVGGHLVNALARLGAAKVLVLDDLSQGHLWRVPMLPNVMFVSGSITNENQLKRVFDEKPCVVFHLAARFANQYSVEQPEADLMTNGVGTLKILDYSLKYGVKRVVYAASSSIYNDRSSACADPPDILCSDLGTPYQISKLLGELYCNFFSKYHGLVTVRPRLFNSYGPGDLPGVYRNVIPNFIYSALQGKKLTITGTGQETRDFTYVEDHVEGFLRAGAFESAANCTFDLGTGKETRIADLGELINHLTGNKAGVRFIATRKWDNKKRRSAAADSTRQLIKFKPETSMQTGLMKTIQWFRENWEQIRESADNKPKAR
jgi:nucleoside-diphosphate-sugar epimerase